VRRPTASRSELALAVAPIALLGLAAVVDGAATILLVAGFALSLAAAAWLFGVDSRDSRDWRRG
jgi:hypothetical protein